MLLIPLNIYNQTANPAPSDIHNKGAAWANDTAQTIPLVPEFRQASKRRSRREALLEEVPNPPALIAGRPCDGSIFRLFQIYNMGTDSITTGRSSMRPKVLKEELA
jgi:hypothetical protein